MGRRSARRRDDETLFCGDLFTQWGRYPASTADDIVGPATDQDLTWMSLGPNAGSVLRRPTDLDVATLAQMHGPACTGDCRAASLDLADAPDQIAAERVERSITSATAPTGRRART